MRLSEFAYELPERLIAQEPATPRDASRMLVINRAQKTWQDAHFADFPSFVQPNDVVVLNNTRVFPARLIGEKKVSGGRVELFLISEREPGTWEALVKPARRIGVGASITFSSSSLCAEVIQCLGRGTVRRQISMRRIPGTRAGTSGPDAAAALHKASGRVIT